MRRWILVLAAVLLLAVPGRAADKQADFAFGYDVASATLTYCTLDGKNGDPFDSTGFQFSAPDFDIEYTTATGAVEDVGTNGSFAALSVGDTIILRGGDQDTSDNAVRQDIVTYVTVVTDTDNIVVGDTGSASANYRAYFYKTLACGTGVEDGWIKVEDLVSVTLSVFYNVGDLGALEVTWECREAANGSSALQVYPGPTSDCGFGVLATDVCSFATAPEALGRELVAANFSQCRIGLSHDGTDGATVEVVNATLSGTTRKP